MAVAGSPAEEEGRAVAAGTPAVEEGDMSLRCSKGELQMRWGRGLAVAGKVVEGSHLLCVCKIALISH